ncbi:MAG: D-glycero-alpha-D-manno-heptose 7-phosphate kinase [Gammaproteobacteria bacterium]|nr:MAG: D-glycero-alpha-D-manno-heptose 7-phosphate kinase [Gammaproteobacteria bacterium]
MIISRTPFRISFFGGGTDYPQWFQKHGGVVLSTSIDKYCYITCRHLPQFFEHKYRIVYSKIENVRTIDKIAHPAVRAVLGYHHCEKGLEIHHDGDLPARSGLGSSSSFTVGLINAVKALDGSYISKEELAAQAIDIEQNIIGESVGSQDQISAAFGGLNRIELLRDGSFQVTPIIVRKERLHELQDNLMLFFTGLSRNAPEIAQSKIENFNNRETELKRIKEMVAEAIALLQGNGPIADFGNLLHENWYYKRTLSNKVTTPEVDSIFDIALANGATGGKLLGAGGGGFVLLFVPPERQALIREKLGHLVNVPFRFENSGSRIVLYQPNGL